MYVPGSWRVGNESSEVVATGFEGVRLMMCDADSCTVDGREERFDDWPNLSAVAVQRELEVGVRAWHCRGGQITVGGTDNVLSVISGLDEPMYSPTAKLCCTMTWR